MKLPTLSLFAFTIALAGSSASAQTIVVSFADNEPQVQFALAELGKSLSGRGLELATGTSLEADITVSIQPGIEATKSEGFALTKASGKIQVQATDPAGAMYGVLELAEQIRISGLEGVSEQFQNPYMEMRGTKFNIPLDMRSPSYTDASDVGQQNIPEMWSFAFWQEYIDTLARYRYNFISLWNLHPFPSMVKVPGYEDVALDDVLRSTNEWKEHYSNDATGLGAPEILENPEVIKKMSIDEKIDFWRRVMAYGKSRNVDFYVVTWNIFLYGADGKYGMTENIHNTTTRDYYRKSVEQMFLTYPDLAGIGITAGENMHESTEEKEEWIFNTYGKGILDAARKMPDRNITFLHRQHMTGAPEIAAKFQPLSDEENVEFLFSFKYAVAHVMSATRQYRHEQFVKDIKGMKTLWTLRNDSNYFFRWGAPDFVREFMKNIPYDVSRGYYYGSDQWVWGREFTSRNAQGQRPLEIVKHWYHWMMWGRLGYNPDLGNERFIQILASHFPGVDGQQLFTAWQEASMVYPTTTGFHWGAADYMWYPEACKSRPRFTPNNTGFHDVNHFIALPPHRYSGFQSIPNFATMVRRGYSTDLLTPLQVAEKLHAHADEALALIKPLDSAQDKELEATLHDIRTMALLGRYYGHKIAGAAQLALYRELHEKEYQDAAVAELEKALDAWKAYADSALQQNINPVWMNRVGHVDWRRITEWVAKDIEIAKE